MPRADRWDELARRYTEDTTGPVAGPVADAVIELLRPEQRARVLDLGCGPGHYARLLARLGCSITGVDPSAALLAVARERETGAPLGIEYLGGDAADPGLLTGRTYDRVLASMSLSDIDDLDGALETVARLLPEGVFVFSILHPCFPGNGPSLPSWPPSGYYDEGWWLAHGHHGYRGVVGANHRTLSTYLNSVVAHGFTVTGVREPAPPDVPVPMFLVVQATR
jgi:SAM-dependent methyltransferase